MNPPVEAAAVQAYLARHLTEVFATMLSLPAEILADAAPGGASGRVSGSVGFVGETVTGAVYLHVPAALAGHMTGAMLGLPAEETPGDAEVNDVVGEVTNMVAGGLKSWLCDAGAACALGTPAIIRGTAFQIIASDGVARVQFGFVSGAHRGVVEAHLKFTN